MADIIPLPCPLIKNESSGTVSDIWRWLAGPELDFAQLAAGMGVERVDEMVAGYGADTMLLIGGGLLSARERLTEKSREFIRAVRGTA